MSDELRPGAVLLVHECYQFLIGPSDDNYNLLSEPRWAIVVKMAANEDIYVDWDGPIPRHHTEDQPVNYISAKWDTFEVTSPDKWPDHVCAWVAKRVLTDE
jgi:hypothetical protein